MTLKQEIIDAAQEVNQELGPRHKEQTYHNALEVELSDRGLRCSSEAKVPIHYKGEMINWARPDMVVSDGEERAVVELKNGKAASVTDQLKLYRRLVLDDENTQDVGTALMVCFNSDGVEHTTVT